MSVDGYLGPNPPKNKVPEESVLCGQPLPKALDYPESVTEMLRPLTDPQPPWFHRPSEYDRETYDSVEDYDPVLFWHCRL
jgi:hypothetical protein